MNLCMSMLVVALPALACAHRPTPAPAAHPATAAAVAAAGEPHLRNIRQLTNGGENAEAYFSGDGR